jgi:hypothetical protein
MQQYPWVLPVAGVLLVVLLVLGWLAVSNRGGLSEEEVAALVAAELAGVYAEQTQTARDRATADAAEAATGTAVAFAPAATQTAAATQAMATAVAISSREEELESEAQRLAGQVVSTPTLTATPTPTDTAAPTPTDTATPEQLVTTPTPRLWLLDDFEGEDSFEVHQYSGNPATAVVDAGALVFDFEIKPDQKHYIGLEWRQPPQDWSSAAGICACMESDLSPGLGVSIEVGESDNDKARKPLIDPTRGGLLVRPCPTDPELAAYCADFDDAWEYNEKLGDRSNIGYFSVFAEAYPDAPQRSGSGTLRIEDIYLSSDTEPGVTLATPKPTSAVSSSQTAEARVLATIQADCPGGPEGEFRVYWDEHKGRLGCPKQEKPIDFGAMAWQEFQGGFMLWSYDFDDSVIPVITSEPNPRWFPVLRTWTHKEGSSECADEFVPPSANLVQPINAFGGVWCDNPEIREALGWGLAKERSVGASIQEFERGIIIRDEDQSKAYILFGDDQSFIRATKP